MLDTYESGFGTENKVRVYTCSFRSRVNSAIVSFFHIFGARSALRACRSEVANLRRGGKWACGFSFVDNCRDGHKLKRSKSRARPSSKTGEI